MRNRLLTFGALCVAGTVGSALLSSTALFPALITGATGLVSNIWATDLGTLWDRFAQRLGGRDAVLQNADLSKAVGNAIAAVLAKSSRLEVYCDYREPLRRLAGRAASGWAELSQLPEFAEEAGLDPIREANLSRLFSVKPAEFAEAKALTPQDWERMLNIWQQPEPEVVRDPQVMAEIAEILHHDFPKALREVLKEDFATGGRAYAGIVLDFVGDLHGVLQDQHNILMSQIDALPGINSNTLEQEFQQTIARLEALTAENADGYRVLSGQIDSGFENISQLLADLGIQLAEVETRILKHQAKSFQQLEEKLDGLQKPVLTVSVAIDSSRPKVVFWQGRHKELETLRQQLKQASLVGITGLGGYGKSALANQLYESSDWPIKIWVTMSQLYRFSELGRWLLGRFGVQLDEKADDDVLATVLSNFLTENHCLVVFDNLETLLESDGQWRLPGYKSFLLWWLEYGRNSAILVTSREQPRLPSLNSYWHPPLMGLQVAEGAALLRDYGIGGDDAAMREFVMLADGHPLLLGLAAALLVDELGATPDISGLKKTELNLFELVGLHHGDPEASVTKLFAASFKRLEGRLQRLLCCVSVYRLPFNSAAAAVMLQETALTWQEAATQRQIEQDLRDLTKRSLLQEAERNTASERRFQFLPLIASYVLQQPNDWLWAHERAIFFYRATAKVTLWESEEDLREYFEAFHHHCELKQFALAYGVLDLCNKSLILQGYSRIIVELFERLVQAWQPTSQQNWFNYSWALISLGVAYGYQGDYSKLINYQKQSLAITRTINDRKGEATCLTNLGYAYNFQGDYPKAIEYLEQSLAITRIINDRYGEANCLLILGTVYCSQGDYPKAIKYQKQSLAITCTIGDRRGKMACLSNIGNTYYSQGDYPKAVEYQKQSLAITCTIGDRTGEAACLGSLGTVYCSQGDYPKAIEHLEQSLAITRTINDRDGEAACLGNLGTVYCSQGDYPKAIEYLEQSLAITCAIGNREREANCLVKLGAVYCSQGDYPKAIEHLEQSLVITCTIGNRKGEANCLTSLGNAYHSQGDYPKAIKYLEQSLAITCAIGDRDGEADCLCSLGTVYCLQGDYPKAIKYLEQSLAITCTIGDCHGEAACLGNLGTVYCSQEDYPKAIEYLEQSLAIICAIGDRKGEAACLTSLGNAYHSRGDYPKAIKYLEQSLAITCAINDRKGEANCLCNLGAVYCSQGDYPKAIKYQKQSLAIICTIGDCHGEANCLCNLGAVYCLQGDYPKAIEYQKQSIAITRTIGDRRGEAAAWHNLGKALSKVDRVPDALGAYRNARNLYFEIGLKTSMEVCDNALCNLSSPLETSQRKTQNFFMQIWQRFKNLVRFLLGS